MPQRASNLHECYEDPTQLEARKIWVVATTRNAKQNNDRFKEATLLKINLPLFQLPNGKTPCSLLVRNEAATDWHFMNRPENVENWTFITKRRCTTQLGSAETKQEPSSFESGARTESSTAATSLSGYDAGAESCAQPVYVIEDTSSAVSTLSQSHTPRKNLLSRFSMSLPHQFAFVYVGIPERSMSKLTSKVTAHIQEIGAVLDATTEFMLFDSDNESDPDDEYVVVERLAP
ncbi:MAG: hypothetical protein MHM6MM_005983 [Cercozoa sp. M6MM]